MGYLGDDSVYRDKTDAGRKKLVMEIEQARKSAADNLKRFHNQTLKRTYFLYHSAVDPIRWQKALATLTPDFGKDMMLTRPEPFIQTEAGVPPIAEALTSSLAPFRAVPFVGARDDYAARELRIANAAAKQHLLTAQLHDELMWDANASLIARQSRRDGSCVAHLSWWTQRVPRWGVGPDIKAENHFGPLDEKGNLTREWQHKTLGYKTQEFPEGEAPLQDFTLVEDGLRMRLVDLPNLFPDPRGKSFNREDGSQPCRYVVEVTELPKDEFITWILSTPRKGWEVPDGFWGWRRETQKEHLNERLKKVEEVTNEFQLVRQWQYELGQVDDTGGMSSLQDRNMIPLQLYYENGPQPWFMIVAGTGAGADLFLRQAEQHPARLVGIPYVMFKPIPKANELFGVSVIEQQSGLTHEMTLALNLYMSSFVRAINGLTVYDIDVFSGGNKLVSSAGGAIGVQMRGREIDKIFRHYERNMPSPDFWRWMDDNRATSNLASQTPDPVMGSSASNVGNTARGYMSAIAQGGKGLDLNAQMLGCQTAQMGRVMDAHNRQYITRERYVKKAGEEGAAAWVAVDHRMIAEPVGIAFDVRPVVVNEALQVQNLLTLGQVAATLPPQGQGWMNGGNFIRRVADKLNVADAGELVNAPMDWPGHENAMFLADGEFPDAKPGQNHKHHQDVHWQIAKEAVARGTQPQWQKHMDQHEAMKGGGAPGPAPAAASGGASAGLPPAGGAPPSPEAEMLPGGTEGNPMNPVPPVEGPAMPAEEPIGV